MRKIIDNLLSSNSSEEATMISFLNHKQLAKLSRSRTVYIRPKRYLISDAARTALESYAIGEWYDEYLTTLQLEIVSSGRGKNAVGSGQYEELLVSNILDAI